MYQYRGFHLDYTDSAISIRDTSGRFIGYCETDAEAVQYIDNYLEDSVDEVDQVEPENYYIYRIHKGDRDCYDNYQYYTGKFFGYRATPKKMTKSQAESILKRLVKRDEYNYYISR